MEVAFDAAVFVSDDEEDFGVGLEVFYSVDDLDACSLEFVCAL